MVIAKIKKMFQSDGKFTKYLKNFSKAVNKGDKMKNLAQQKEYKILIDFIIMCSDKKGEFNKCDVLDLVYQNTTLTDFEKMTMFYIFGFEESLNENVFKKSPLFALVRDKVKAIEKI
jgi:hypothetical protein